MKVMFDSMDLDGSGTVEIEELKKFMAGKVVRRHCAFAFFKPGLESAAQPCLCSLLAGHHLAGALRGGGIMAMSSC